MAGIRVNTPVGEGWDYSLSLDTPVWQSSPVFLHQQDGGDFVSGTTYSVYCRLQSLSLIVVNEIVFGLRNSDTKLPITLDAALQGGANSAIVPLFEGGLAAILSVAPDGSYPRVVVGPDGTFYLDSAVAPPPTSLRVVSVDELYSLVADVVPVLPSYVMRLDLNTCGATPDTHGEIRGWGLDLNNLENPITVRLEVDGSIVDSKVCNIERPDVRDAFLAPAGYPTQATRFGFTFNKPGGYDDGKPHTWRVFAKDTAVEATSDVGAQNTITCGTIANRSPVLTNPMPDVLIKAAGDQTFYLPADQYVDPDGDPITRYANEWNGSVMTLLPSGVDYNPATGGITVKGTYPNREFPIRVTAADSKGNGSEPDDFLLTIARPVAPVTLTSISIDGPSSVLDNSQTQYQAIAHFSNGSLLNITAQAEWGVGNGRKTDGSGVAAPVIGTDGGLLKIYMGISEHYSVLFDLHAYYNGVDGVKTITANDDNPPLD